MTGASFKRRRGLAGASSATSVAAGGSHGVAAASGKLGAGACGIANSSWVLSCSIAATTLGLRAGARRGFGAATTAGLGSIGDEVDPVEPSSATVDNDAGNSPSLSELINQKLPWSSRPVLHVPVKVSVERPRITTLLASYW
jgi:hypothetical protein